MDKKVYLVGVDFGTDSARAIIVDGSDGKIMGEAQQGYKRWSEGKYQNPDIGMYRQHPMDYIEAFEASVCNALDAAGEEVRRCVAGISIDATGSTPCPVNEEGTPLALIDEFWDNENAMFHLWKDHTAIKEAIEIDIALSDFRGINYTKYQGTYCSEWYWAKILHTSRIDKRVKAAAYSWVEHCDWLTGMLAGRTEPKSMYRCACAAGHKALWHSEWDGLPSVECLDGIDPYLADVALTFGRNVHPSDYAVGRITKEWAERLRVPGDTIVGGTSLDAHAGAVGAGVDKNTLVANIGTSSVYMMVENAFSLKGKNLVYSCGQAENSIIPGCVGIETSQAAFGDIFAWLRKLLMWPVRNLGLVGGETADIIEEKLIASLAKEAEKLDLKSALTAIDWLNGRRYPNTNEMVKGAISGLSLGTEAPEIFQALVLAALFGLKRIVDNLQRGGIQIDEIIAVGGIPRKSPYIMQSMADILERKVSLSASTQACARGAAIYAAASCGLYDTVKTAQDSICEGFVGEYSPNMDKRDDYIKLYEKYCELGEVIEGKINSR